LDNSYSFEIGNNVFDEVTKASVRMLYLQRCGCETTNELAGVYAHPACHNTDAKIYGTNDYIDVTGGWHDAGDYGRYVVAGAKTIADLFMTYEDSSASRGDNYDIPESGNGVPDILDEARYELEWMLKMQAENGGVYHKVTCEQFPGVVMPQNETEELVVAPISTTATGDFAAVMAKAGKIYRQYDGAFASKCSEAAVKAYAYMEENADKDKTGFINPPEIVTGEYPDGDNTDEYVWAAVELYLTTNDPAYLTKVRELTDKTFKGGLGWADMGTYAMYDFLKAKGYMETPVEFNLPADDTRSIQEIYASMSDVDYVRMKFSEKLNLFAETALEYSTTDPYFSSLRIYPWGSNMTIANNGILYRMMYNLTGDEVYNEYARYQIDYLLGVNAVAYSYVTGFGEHAAEHPHHRPSQAIGKAMPGMLVGGPNSSPADPYAIKALSKKVGGSCYCDNDSAYSINEITIYWNSPLIYLLEVYK
ncbi:MAG: glycoside hydrolase family 9 protein, partial [Lachnospiraceae bacterium]|nr:glycoside hydrolase family 9 protein [Lachnospiraceae bacterium]